MSYLKGIRTITIPTRDMPTSITAWTQLLGTAPSFQSPDFTVIPDGDVEIALAKVPWANQPLVFWTVENIEEAHRALVASGAKAMGEVASGMVAELGTAPVTNGDPMTGIVDLPHRRIAALRMTDGTLIGILQEQGPRA